MTVEGTVQSIEVSATPQHVLQVALDLEAYPEWVTACDAADVLEEDEQGRPLRAAFVFQAAVKCDRREARTAHQRETASNSCVSCALFFSPSSLLRMILNSGPLALDTTFPICSAALPPSFLA